MSIVLSTRWLSEWMKVVPKPEVMADVLTAKGIEVESIEVVGEGLSGVVVGEILSCEPHPDADRLSLCTVSIGAACASPLSIVCGCPSVAVGLRVAVATVGTCLPGDFKIKKSKIRGHDSEGMLCARSELGLMGEAKGIMHLPLDAPVGMDFSEYIAAPDTLLDCFVTPNRGDCLSMLGMVREYAASEPGCSWDWPFSKDTYKTTDQKNASKNVVIHDQAACPAYALASLKEVNSDAVTPLWMQERLLRAGFRLVNIVVDITQYVMLELGQPMHAFDADEVVGPLHVRCASDQPQKKIHLLDDQHVTLDPKVLLITDDEKALAIAGVMGAQAGSVSHKTRTILLESAFFSPETVAYAARKQVIHTDSSMRFERGVDPTLHTIALKRALDLLAEYAGAELVSVASIQSEQYLKPAEPINLPKTRIKRLLGCALPDDLVLTLLKRLNMEASISGDAFHVVPPKYRFDINASIDLIEELVRLWGYDQIPTRTLSLINQEADYHKESCYVRERLHLGLRLAEMGYHEVVSYSFVPDELQKKLCPSANAIHLLNPMSQQMDVMRVSLLPGLLMTAARNIQRRSLRIQLYEMGRCFIRDADKTIRQHWHLAFLVTGMRSKEQWGVVQRPMDFYDLKGDLTRILGDSLAGSVEYKPLTDASMPTYRCAVFHPGQSAGLYMNGEWVGVLGKLHPSWVKTLGVFEDTYLCEWFKPDLLLVEDKPFSYAPLSKYPSMRRDVSFWVEENVVCQDMEQAIRESAGKFLTDLTLFDVYHSKDSDNKRRSLSWSLYFQHAERTLTDEEIQACIQSVIASVESNCRASIRSE
jgi:phenylalanyl-tRNA synthetase beta chain